MANVECKNLVLCTFTEEFQDLPLDITTLHTSVCQVAERVLKENDLIDIEVLYHGDINKIEYHFDVELTAYQKAELDILFMGVMMSMLGVGKELVAKKVGDHENYYYVECQFCFSISDDELSLLKNHIRRLFKEVLKSDIDGELEVLEIDDEPYIDFDIDHGLSEDEKFIIQSLLYITIDYILGLCDPSDPDNWDYADA
ncbi:MAG: hypothetical protein AUJ28_03435 [Parcubacteria group bacterium CG1_02_37_51]|uniref:Uncharacterized protein n=2 Tax=Candidatus Komeiliibacteriota TaxID=1817908 RepID=A0A2M8DR95_9BACT|nr:MAG: hypothetical protein AUJ28_03435 [Parcubacteria group bacterium CG1_02_37_51]PIY94811.1 MAG: hypothetical protein COY67_01940 [Candidatus Komeilibacteria bacterium CG_4_10_14_0_8_um_filter_37_78]PJC01887.1 MAG: hypothetical protein CO073_02400 [Candidatus Komeilibacteria bacterium CG_4_9_14_0_8_um_filter_36_9]